MRYNPVMALPARQCRPGFRTVGLYHKHGGRDVLIVERQLEANLT